MGQRNSKQVELDKNYEAECIRFSPANNKSLRLYFQSQFTPEMEDEDLIYLNHIFELKVFLYFNRHYYKGHLINTNSFIEETFEKNIETIFSEIKQINMIDTETDENQDELIDDFFSFSRKRKSPETPVYNTCKVNYYLTPLKEIPQEMELSLHFRNQIFSTEELEIYTLLNDYTNVTYFALNRIFSSYNTNLRKIVVFQVGLKTIDELLYTALAKYLISHPNVNSVCISEKKWGGLKHIENDNFNEDDNLNEERLESPIINRQHFFNFYQSLSARNNLIELKVLFFITDYNFIMLTNVININKNLQVLHVRNVGSKDTEIRGRDLDFGFYEQTQLGENLRDEIFIFFNYLTQLEQLEELQLTHFLFNSEVNFLACEMSKNLKNLKVLSLDRNQAIVNNDTTAFDNYNFEATNIEKLNIGLSYLNMVRRFDYIVHAQKMIEVNIGVLDFVSFSAFVRYIPNTVLQRVTLTLNKPTAIESIPFLFEQIYTYPFKSNKLKFLYILNAFTNSTYKEKTMNSSLVKLIDKMKESKTLRKLSFKKPCILYTSIKETEIEKANGFRTFRYINKRDYNLCAVLIIVLRKYLFNKVMSGDYIDTEQSNIMGNLNGNFTGNHVGNNYTNIFKNILQFRFANFRKIVLE